MNHRFRGVAAAALTSLALVLSACGGSPASPVSAGSDGRVHLRVTSLQGGLCEELGLYAQDGGFFTKNGLDVEFVPATGGNAGVAALQAGSADVVFVSSVAAINAMAKGVDLTIVSGAVRPGPQGNGIVVKADSPIRGPGQLAGKTIGVLELSGMGATSTKKWVENATGGAANIKFVQLPFPELVPAVLKGTVDAVQVTASEIYQVTKDGTGRSIGNSLYEAAAGSTPTGMYAASSGFVAKNQKTMEKFVTAMQDAANAANDPANKEHFDVFSRYCKKPAQDLAQLPRDGQPTYEGYVDQASFLRIVQFLHDARLIPADFHPETKVAEFARAKG